MKSKTTIEVNGKRYDATTGAIIGPAISPPATTGRNIDGFFRERTTQHHKAKAVVVEESVAERITVVAAPAPAPAPKPRSQSPRTINHHKAHSPQSTVRVAVHAQAPAPQTAQHSAHTVHVSVNHAKHRVPQSSTTLMRTAVQRPNPSFHAQAGTVGALQHSVPSLIVPKSSIGNVDEGRLVRAQEVPRNPHISRHTAQGAPSIFATVAPLAVQPAPTAPPAKPGTEDPVDPAPTPKPTNKPVDNMFDHALANATHFVDTHAHTKHFKKQVRRHMASMASGTMALLVIAAFAAYQNTPGLQFKVASVRAGVSTSMPNFEAAGFAYNGARAENGKLTVGFSGNQGDFQMVQQTTNLTGDEVIQNIGATTAGGKPTYHAVQAGSTVIYRFTNTDATWVSGGTWYTVNGTGALSDAQVAHLVQNI